MSSSAATKLKPQSQARSSHSIVGRTPGIKLTGDIMASPFALDQPGTTIAAGRFKATCLQLLDRAAEGQSIAITKRGKVVARLIPPDNEDKAFVPLLGLMKGKGRILGDIVSPDFEAWGMKDPGKPKKKKK